MQRIREAALTDATAINSLSTELGYLSTPDNIAENRLANILSSNSDKVWVFEIDSEIKGWLHAFLTARVASEAFIEIGGLAVDPLSRRQGVGRKLVVQAQLWAQEQNTNLRVRCSSVRENSHVLMKRLVFQRLRNNMSLTKIYNKALNFSPAALFLDCHCYSVPAP